MRAVLLAVLLLAACTGASPSLAPTPEPVRILADGLSVAFREPFSVAVARDETEWLRLWQGFDRGADQPAVDLAKEMLIYLGMAGSSSCPEAFSHLVVDAEAARVYGAWQGRSGTAACTDDLQGQGVLLAVSRDVLPQSNFVLSLRESLLCADCHEHPDQIVVTGS